jgi:predicted GNAT family acetyltransferase
MSVEVRDNRDQARYEIWTGGRRAGFAQYRLDPGSITFVHTEIDPEHEGAGLGGRLARAALDDVRTRQLTIVPLCPFIAEYIRRHPDDYLDLVVPAMRKRLAEG